MGRHPATDPVTDSSLTQDITAGSPVRLQAVTAQGQPEVTPALEELYRGFEKELLVPLWTEIGDLMPAHPHSRAVPHVWRWERLRELAAQAGDLVPVGRGGERRVIAPANPSLGGRPFATPTLWAAIHYLMPGEDAPEHRHTQHAFRFVVEGSRLPAQAVRVHRPVRGRRLGTDRHHPDGGESTRRLNRTRRAHLVPGRRLSGCARSFRPGGPGAVRRG